MNGLAHMVMRGRPAQLVARNAELLGLHQERCIVRLRDEACVGVYDAAREVLVVFDAAALVALAETEASEEMAHDIGDVASVAIDPPSRL
jgi:hypothetical protein